MTCPGPESSMKGSRPRPPQASYCRSLDKVSSGVPPGTESKGCPKFLDPHLPQHFSPEARRGQPPAFRHIAIGLEP